MRGKEEYTALRETVNELERAGLVISDEQGRIGYVSARKAAQTSPKRLIGRLTVTRKGYGRVRVEGVEEEIQIAPKFMKTALHGDIVAVIQFARPLGRRRDKDESDNVEGEIVEIIKRTHTTVVGTLEEGRTYSFVIPDDPRFTRDIYVSKEDALQAKHGDKVVVQLQPWEDEHLNPEGTIVEVLGPSSDARVEVLSVARSFGLPAGFSPSVLHEAEECSETIPADELRRRIDYRKVRCFTIDPEDARDFDDAISYEVLDNGNIRLGVHIADVSHFVREGSQLDAEALARGTSVYLVNEVVPMLPERLSNDLCSLKPHVDRLTFSVFMDVNHTGKVEDYRIGKSVICSARRFAYEEVQKIIDDKKGDLADVILPLFSFTQTLMKQRRRHGSIDFDTGEVKFKFDASGLPSLIVKKERLDAHRLVEECMLLANRTVAEHIGIAKKEESAKPFVYRVHDVPDPSRIADLANFVKQFGYSLDARNGVSSRTLQQLLDKVKGSDVENLINEVALRSMAKAVYAEKNIGHYGLGFKHYTHFTSPIRRYPDLIVHRLLQEYSAGLTARRRTELEKDLPAVCRQTSERERVAVEAERASVKVMQVEYMKRHVGDEFEGVISGVTEFGIFVEINDLLVEGLVRMRDLLDDYYLFDEKHYSLRGRNRGKIYRLGDKVNLKVVSVNPEDRQIDFSIID